MKLKYEKVILNLYDYAESEDDRKFLRACLEDIEWKKAQRLLKILVNTDWLEYLRNENPSEVFISFEDRHQSGGYIFTRVAQYEGYQRQSQCLLSFSEVRKKWRHWEIDDDVYWMLHRLEHPQPQPSRADLTEMIKRGELD